MFCGHGHGDHKEFFKDIKHDMVNEGDKLVITISGDKDKLAKIEKKIKAFHTLCCGDDCC
ncbi:hypothetical protein ACFL3C_01925 [Patescibacteria group bacterium]